MMKMKYESWKSKYNDDLNKLYECFLKNSSYLNIDINNSNNIIREKFNRFIYKNS